MADSKKFIFTLDEDIVKKLVSLKELLEKKDSKHIETAAEKIGEVVAELQAAVKESPPVDSLTDLSASKQRVANLEAQVQALQTVIDTVKTEMEAAISPEMMDKRLESRGQIVQVATNVVKDFKADGRSDKEIMIEVINSVMPKKDGKDVITKDSKEEVIDAQYGAAVELARIKSLQGGFQGPKKEIKTDQAQLDELKDKRLTMKEDADKARKEAK